MGITSTGVGSGLDVESIVSQLMSVERRPVTLLQAKETELKAQLSSYGQMQSYLSAFRDKANALSSVSLWKQTVASSSDAVAVKATSASGAASGTYSVSVQKLAQSQTLSTPSFSSSSALVGEGSLLIELGSWGGEPATEWTAKEGATGVTIEIGSGETSLSSIRDKINAASAGVTASIVNDSNGARLALRSTTSGAENGFRVTATPTSENSLDGVNLGYIDYQGEGTSSMSLNQKGSNAEATINGITISSATNELTDVSEGLNLTLLKEGSSVDVTVGPDTEAVKTAMDAFVSAYNDLNSYIRNQTKYDAESKNAGRLQGDRTTIGMQNRMRSLLRETTSASSVYTQLSEIGMEVQKDGSLTLKSSTFATALTKLSDLQAMLSNDDDATPTSNGLARRFWLLADDMLNTDGAIDSRTTGLKETISRNTKRQEAIEDRLAQTEKRMRAQYQALDTNMAKLTALNSYMNQQLAAMSFK